MKPNDIISELAKSIPNILASDLIKEFLELRKDLQTLTLNRASCGKFIETVLQILEHLETGTYSTAPSVDAYLKNLESRSSILNDDLRIVLSRVARATYTLRNKRNILHKGLVDTNVYDLKFIYSASQWILTEFVRQYITGNIHRAGEIVEFIQLPVNSVIEIIDGRRIIHAKLTVKEEALIIIYSIHPNRTLESEIYESMDRRADNTIYKGLKSLWEEKLIHVKSKEYLLTQAGFQKAQQILKKI